MSPAIVQCAIPIAPIQLGNTCAALRIVGFVEDTKPIRNDTIKLAYEFGIAVVYKWLQNCRAIGNDNRIIQQKRCKMFNPTGVPLMVACDASLVFFAQNGGCAFGDATPHYATQLQLFCVMTPRGPGNALLPGRHRTQTPTQMQNQIQSHEFRWVRIWC